MGVRHQTKVPFQTGFIVIYQAHTQKDGTAGLQALPNQNLKKLKLCRHDEFKVLRVALAPSATEIG